ncbi:MAG: hypothetical protein K0S09_2414 [Sphingobacteriaceae bacterium]|jgi:YbbR domain-containing protein|nr:hypothetical protein [Sphingobacteriaceae bacterium]
MPFLILNKSERRKLSLFFTCLGLAVLLWLFYALSSQYDYQIRTNVHYTDFPQNKAFHPLQSDTVNLSIKGTGWQLLFSRILNVDAVNVDLRKLNSRNYITFTEQLGRINKQFNSNQKVISVSPDTLYFDFSSRTVKRVPIRLRYNIKFKPQFGISGKPIINPEYVVVTGAAEDLTHIDFWVSDSLKASDVSSSIFSQVTLKRSAKTNISIYPNVVDVRIPVDQFTETSFDVPVNVLNSRSYDVKTLPGKVKITFLTALSNYHHNTPDSFEATLDLNLWKQFGYSQLPVHLSKRPPYCKIVSIQPQAVDFIVKD